MDPAVVATSTTAPPQLITQQLVTMQQVIPQTSQLGSQPESEHLDNHGHDPNAGRGDYNGSSGNGVENMGQGQMQMPSEGQGGHEGDEINEFHPQHHHQQHQQQNWNGKNTKSGGGYGANPIEIMEGNDFRKISRYSRSLIFSPIYNYPNFHPLFQWKITLPIGVS